MIRKSLFLCVLVAGCGRGPDQDLQYITQARSLGAEWALVNEQAAQNKLTRPYVRTMRAELRQQLQTASSSLTQPDSRYAEEMQALLAEPDDAAPEELRSHSDKLKQIEDNLESA